MGFNFLFVYMYVYIYILLLYSCFMIHFLLTVRCGCFYFD